MAKRIMYMHTIRGLPARYEPGRQVVIAQTKPAHLVESLAQIRKERRASEAWRRSRGFEPGLAVYGHVRVEVPL